MENIPQSRRTFITTLTLLIASAALLVKYLVPRTGTGHQVLVSAAGSDIPHNGALVYREQRLALVRNDGGIAAFSLVCTHLGCTVVVTEDAFSCPCHGSIFDLQGNVVKGPADRPLVRLPWKENNGMIEVYGA